MLENMKSNCLIVPLSQLDEIKIWLDSNNYSYSVDETLVISIDGTEETICINVDSNVDLRDVEQKFNLNKDETICGQVDGKQIARGRRQLINRCIDMILQKAQSLNIDWNTHDLLIKVTENKK